MISTIYIFVAFILGVILACLFFAVKKPDGVMEVSEEDEKTLYQLVLFSEIDKLPKKTHVTFKVIKK